MRSARSRSNVSISRWERASDASRDGRFESVTWATSTNSCSWARSQAWRWRSAWPAYPSAKAACSPPWTPSPAVEHRRLLRQERPDRVAKVLARIAGDHQVVERRAIDAPVAQNPSHSFFRGVNRQRCVGGNGSREFRHDALNRVCFCETVRETDALRLDAVDQASSEHDVLQQGGTGQFQQA